MNVVLPTTTDARDRAAAEQRRASNPAVSAFVAASAGSGKTKLLTDRLLRLMLAGAEPGRIVCLTYTRAGAAEMALRLRAALGAWVVADDAWLARELTSLDVAPGPAAMARARALFATILDLPGGLRIGTIHAFCQSLLARFPLEAGLSPRFGLIEDADARVAQADAIEQVLARGRHAVAVERLSVQTTLSDLQRLIVDVSADREAFAAAARMGADAVAARQRMLLGAGDGDAVAAAAVEVADAVRDAWQALLEQGSPKFRAAAATRLDWLSRSDRLPGLGTYIVSFFRADGQPYAAVSLANADFRKRHPIHAAAIDAEAGRIVGVRDALAAIEVAELSAALAAVALPATATFEAGKAATARLDYADMITRTLRLLREQPGASWVLHKLDGGIDHLLLDEVQDTAPDQWEIAAKLTEEFFAGEGARDDLPVARTFFAVGDRKQSIFSFQGADPAGFDDWRERYRRRVADGGAMWADVTLDVSFRSTVPVLALVDAVFAGDPDGLGAVPHISSRPGQAGSVELWPLLKRPEKTPVEPYVVPRAREPRQSATQALVDQVADWIAAATGGATRLDSHGRPLAAGDILVLVRNRGAIPRPLIRALKQRRVPVAGLDVMVLTDEPAVADLLALCDALLLPADDLTVGCVLTSPLGDLAEDALMDLAMDRPRGQTLWDALRSRAAERPDWGRAWAMLAALFARVDHVTPHALLSEALGVHGGQARLLRRLGVEAADPVAELLAASLAHARTHAPSLQGFVHWLRRSAAVVKREGGGAGGGGAGGGGVVRIMTVHGAKGLQAPVVILPDTTADAKGAARLLWADCVPLWSPNRETSCPEFDRRREIASARADAEERRLLYVALTRAEDRLIVCGKPHGNGDDAHPDSWYARVAAGMARLGAAACPQTAAPDRIGRGAQPATHAPLPAWAGAAPGWIAVPPAPEPARPARLVPSRPEGAALGAVPATVSPLTARAPDQRFVRGRLVHGLLQHLPDLPPALRETAARRLLARPAHGLDAAAQDALWAEIAGVLGQPLLADAFAPGSRAEVPLSGVIGDQLISGLVDRLAVTEAGVLLVDYKTNRAPPATVDAVPVMYLRQMAAYAALLAAIHPALPVRCVLVWTAAATVMPLPPALLRTHAPTG